MKIAVLAKYCVDPSGLIADKSGSGVDLDRSSKKIGESDLNAVEEAVRIKSAQGATVHIFLVARSESSKAARELLAMGADKAFLISDPAVHTLDAYSTADIIKKAIEKYGPYELILAGHASEDNYSGAVPLMLAQMLGIAHLAYAKKLFVEKDTVKVERTLEEKTEVIEADAPVLVTVTRELNTPRYPTSLQLLKVPRDALTMLRFSDLGIKSNEPEHSILQEQLELRFVTAKRKNIILEGMDAQAASKKLLEMLKSEGVLS